MRRGRRQTLKSGDEYDVVCARHWYKYLKRSSIRMFVKRALNKRERKDARRKP